MATLRGAARTPNALARQIDAFMREVPGMVRRVLRRGARRYKNEYTARRLSGRPGLNVGTGGMRKSFQVRVEKLATTYRLTSKIGGRNIKGTNVHEYGATIVPKRKPFLVFPIFAKGTARGGVPIRWVKTKSVTIPPRLRFRKSFNEAANRIRIDLKNEYRRLTGKRVRRI